MNNGIKPTRLWYLTGKKHFASLLKDRHEALPRPLTTRIAKESLKLYSVVIASAAAICYSYGMMSPPRDFSKTKKPLGDPCEHPPKKCSPSGAPGPCPINRKDTKPQPCPACEE